MDEKVFEVKGYEIIYTVLKSQSIVWSGSGKDGVCGVKGFVMILVGHLRVATVNVSPVVLPVSKLILLW